MPGLPEQSSPLDLASQPHNWLFSRLAVLMFLQHAALGFWAATNGTYIALNTGERGTGIFDSGFVGLSSSAGAIGALVSPVVIGWLADRRFSSERLLFVLHVLASGALVGMALSQTQWQFFLSIVLYFQFYVPTATLSSSLIMRHVESPHKSFPPLRAIGTSGWILSGLIIGFAYPAIWGQSIEGTHTPMWLAVGCELLLALYCLTLPKTPPMRSATAGWKNWVGGGQLWGNRAFVLFVLISVIACIPSQFFNTFFNVYLNELNYQGAAAQMTLCQLTEVFCMFAMPWLLIRLGLKRLFLIGVSAWTIRFVMLAYGEQAPSLVYLAMLLHGAAFTFVYITGQLYIDQLADRSSRAAAQGVLMLVVQGGGHLAGSLFARSAQAVYLTPEGVSPAPYDWHSYWLVPAAISGVAAVTFAIFFSEMPRAKRKEPEVIIEDDFVVPAVDPESAAT